MSGVFCVWIRKSSGAPQNGSGDKAVDDEGEIESPIELSLSIAGLFVYPSPVDDRELAEAWLEWNGVYLLWPISAGT